MSCIVTTSRPAFQTGKKLYVAGKYMTSSPRRATARPMAIMSRHRRRPCADAARLGASPTSTTTRSKPSGTSTMLADGASTKTRKRWGVSCRAIASTSRRANRPKPRRLDRQLPSIPILMAGLTG